MSEGAIGLGHSMGIFLFLYRRASIIRRVDKFSRQLLFHGLFAALPRCLNQPAHAERKTSLRPHFDRHLIGRATDPAGANFDSGAGIFDRSFEYS